MLLMASRSRPQNLARLLQSFKDTGVTTSALIYLDQDDPCLSSYIEVMAGHDIWPMIGPRIGAGPAINKLFARERNQPFYGIVADDLIPRTAQWDRILGDAARGGIAYGDDGFQGRNLPTHPFLDGDLFRRIGWLTLPDCKHWFVDNAWRAIGEALNCLRYVPEVILEHMHPLAGKAEHDRSYEESTAMAAGDQGRYAAWEKEELPYLLRRLREAKAA